MAAGVKNFAKIELLVRRYFQQTGHGVALLGNGRLVRGWHTDYPWHALGERANRMAEEAIRWGEPNLALDAWGAYLWCVPITDNNRLVGGLFCHEEEPHSQTDEGRTRRVKEDAQRLLDLVIDTNLCNEALMTSNREQARLDARRAEAIHATKGLRHPDPRELYLREEAELLEAIRRGDLERARRSINQVLLSIYHLGRESRELLKALLIEAMVLMSRAVLAGGVEGRRLLATNTRAFREITGARDEEQLTALVSRWLEEFIRLPLARPKDVLSSLAPALELMRRNLDRPISRAEAAAACNLSESHFSRMFTARLGTGFAATLQRFRVERARRLLADPERGINQIAVACGFADASYFARVFRTHTGLSPRAYRKTLESA